MGSELGGPHAGILFIIFLPGWLDQPSLDFGSFALEPWPG